MSQGINSNSYINKYIDPSLKTDNKNDSAIESTTLDMNAPTVPTIFVSNNEELNNYVSTQEKEPSIYEKFQDSIKDFLDKAQGVFLTYKIWFGIKTEPYVELFKDVVGWFKKD